MRSGRKRREQEKGKGDEKMDCGKEFIGGLDQIDELFGIFVDLIRIVMLRLLYQLYYH